MVHGADCHYEDDEGRNLVHYLVRIQIELELSVLQILDKSASKFK